MCATSITMVICRLPGTSGLRRVGSLRCRLVPLALLLLAGDPAKTRGDIAVSNSKRGLRVIPPHRFLPGESIKKSTSSDASRRKTSPRLDPRPLLLRRTGVSPGKQSEEVDTESSDDSERHGAVSRGACVNTPSRNGVRKVHGRKRESLRRTSCRDDDSLGRQREADVLNEEEAWAEDSGLIDLVERELYSERGAKPADEATTSVCQKTLHLRILV